MIDGRYRVVKRLGSGGMADVFWAHDTQLSREVAVKVFREVPSSEVEWMRQEREIQLLATLNHPGLISLHDAGVHVFGDETRLYLVMELMSDPTLDVRMAEGPMAAHDIASIGAQVAEALAYIHSRGVVHRPRRALVCCCPSRRRCRNPPAPAYASVPHRSAKPGRAHPSRSGSALSRRPAFRLLRHRVRRSGPRTDSVSPPRPCWSPRCTASG